MIDAHLHVPSPSAFAGATVARISGDPTLDGRPATRHGSVSLRAMWPNGRGILQ